MILPVTSTDKCSQCSQSGFSLPEVLIVVTLILLLAAAATPLYSSLQSSTQLNESAREFSQTLHTARTRAVSRLNDSPHGVYVQSGQYILYQGENYASRDTAHDRTIVFDNALTLSSSPSVTDINFSEGFGVPSATSTFTLTHDVYGTITITVDALGSIQ